ncbi:MAG: PIN domain-containing protein [Actinobacteria bacterium]|nr:PIN domain-containing protein [Actinomycetota bacterium]
MIFLDTNIFLRYFEREDELIYKKVERLFLEIVQGNIIAISNALVIAEVIWVLKKFYDWDKGEICNNIELILKTSNIKFRERSTIIEAVNFYRDKNINFIDAYNFSYMKYYGINRIYSFDKDFDKLENIKRIEP